MPGGIDTVDADEHFARAKTACFDGVGYLLARCFLGLGCNRILEVKNQAVDRQRPRLFQRARIGARHIEEAATRPDSHWRLSPCLRAPPYRRCNVHATPTFQRIANSDATVI